MPFRTTPGGFLWDRIEIHKPSASPDLQGGEVRAYALAITVPGGIGENSGESFSQSEGRMISWKSVGAWLDLRADPSLSPKAGDRLMFKGKTYEVLSEVKMEGLVDVNLKEIVP